MGTVTVNSRFGDIDVRIAGDTPTLEEFFKIDDIKSNPQDYVSDNVIQSYKSSIKGEDQTFDYATGIQDGKLRRMLGRADTRGDEEKVLKSQRHEMLGSEAKIALVIAEKIPFWTEVRLKCGCIPDIVCPTNVKPIINPTVLYRFSFNFLDTNI